MTKEKWQRQKLQLRSSLLILTSFKLSFEFQDMIEKFSLGGFCAHIGFRTQRQSKVIHPKYYKHLIKSSSHKDFYPEFSIEFRICCEVHRRNKTLRLWKEGHYSELHKRISIRYKLKTIMVGFKQVRLPVISEASVLQKGWELKTC